MCERYGRFINIGCPNVDWKTNACLGSLRRGRLTRSAGVIINFRQLQRLLEFRSWPQPDFRTTFVLFGFDIVMADQFEHGQEQTDHRRFVHSGLIDLSNADSASIQQRGVDLLHVDLNRCFVVDDVRAAVTLCSRITRPNALTKSHNSTSWIGWSDGSTRRGGRSLAKRE